ncbi:helix-turn-helix transcriptional regulator [Aquisalimonas sp. 2447]|uniref:helix-turn-helix transcriptional regulator n=1 Tax=Aquisalimonas sp. 2447 TaxID=2740807 RepID=UPI0014325B63|nr:helix-turn-helix transcriptional regulator [Aquisalimonas sp. 2447]QIT56194.1 helix-turn-helix transcriptional regulator [Aquisalimonas sp. 2447]
MKHERWALSEFLLELYENARTLAPASFQQTTLASLKRFVGFDFAAWGGGSAPDRQVTDVVVLNQSVGLFREWMEVAHCDQYCDLALRRLNHTVLFDDLARFRHSFAYNEHWRRFDARNMVATIMAEPLDGYVSFIGLCNTDIRERFTEEHRETKQLLMPHLSAALRLNRETQLLLEAEPAEGLAIVNRAGWVLASRSPFAALMRAEWGATAHRMPHAVLPQQPMTRHWRGRAVQIRMQPLGEYYLVRVAPRTPLDRMTEREQQVAERFACGLSYKEVARELGIAPGTVRNHLAHIYDKLGVSTKLELVRLLSG